jgi:DNA-directed RNA polymerase specialized sigma subunit
VPKFVKQQTFADSLAAAATESRKKKEEGDQPFHTWRKSQKPEDLQAVVDHYKPVIETAARAILGREPNPIVRERARLLAAEAVTSYDPTRGVPLKHHIQSQLSPLRRYHQQLVEAVPTPERLRREQAILHRGREELWDQLDREPTPEELADHTGIGVKKQLKIERRARVGLAVGQLQQQAEADGDDQQEFLPGVKRVDPRKEIEDYVYYDLDPEDQLIFSARTGYRGAPVRSNNEVARMLKLSPGAVSQRAARIEQRIRELQNG